MTIHHAGLESEADITCVRCSLSPQAAVAFVELSGKMDQQMTCHRT